MNSMTGDANKPCIRDVVEIDGRPVRRRPRQGQRRCAGAGDHADRREIHAELGTRPLASEEFVEHFGDLPSDGEG